MKTYQYKVTGEYADWCELRKNNVLIHYGSSLLVNVENGLKLTLNHGTRINFNYELKKSAGLFIAIPKEPECFSEDYLYIPLIYTETEFNELINVSYIDKSLTRNISLATKEDIIKIWLFTFNNRFPYSSYTELKSKTLNSIIAFSNYDEEIYKFLDFNIFKNEKINITTINEKAELITIYLDIKNKIYEWNSIIKIEENFYLKIDDIYMIKFE